MRKVRKPYDLLMVTLALLFRPSTTPLENSLIALTFFPGAGDNNSAVVSLVADSGGTPTGTLLDSWNVLGLLLFGDSNGILQTLVTNTTITLTAATPYWILVAPRNPNSDVVWNAALTPAAIAEINTGSGWTTQPSAEAFEVLSPSPEPDSLLLLGMGIGLMAARAGVGRLTTK